MTREEAIEYGKEQLDIFGEGCQHYEFIKMAISALEKENIYDDKENYVTISKALYDKLNVDACEDAVSREAVKEALRNRIGESISECINAIPPINLIPCEDAISRTDMLDAIGHGTTYTSEELQKIITKLPSVKD